MKKLDKLISLIQIALWKYFIISFRLFTNLDCWLLIIELSLGVSGVTKFHSTCQECDGTTKTDCLFCFESSIQIQLLQVQTKSICKVVSMDISNLTMLVFEVHLQIWIMLSHVLNVYRIQGMDEYALLTSLYSHDDGNISQYIYETDLCYKFVGNDLNYYLCEDECLHCQFFEHFNSNIQQITNHLINKCLSLPKQLIVYLFIFLTLKKYVLYPIKNFVYNFLVILVMIKQKHLQIKNWFHIQF
ncbi:unnamed protein product [Paramecium primaurelia]|uniref:Transmembrane protein n=1 Tax=Paramecium primaurelia TaxID=5886 RepID=A0A8S1Q7S7_PARPR|nr:unnamed protein product [Paramecium primaurelia]